MSRAVMQQALEALEALKWKGLPSFVEDATTALRQALAEPEQEPVAVHQYRTPHCPYVKAKRDLVEMSYEEVTDHYLNNPHKCPRCDSDDLHNDSTIEDFKHLIECMRCLHCGLEFEEHYTLSRICYDCTQPVLDQGEDYRDE